MTIAEMNKLTQDRHRLFKSLMSFVVGWETRYGENVVGDESLTQYERNLLSHATIKMWQDRHSYVSLSQEDKFKISYAKKAIDKYSNNRRVKTSLARYMRRQMGLTPEDIPDHILQKLNNYVFGDLATVDDCIRIVKGIDIIEAYKHNFGSRSCMCGSASQYLDIYRDNPQKISLIKFDDGNKQARALLWKADDNTRIVDRIYPTDCGQHQELIKAWATKRGYFVRYAAPDFQVTLQDPESRLYPYLDTFNTGDFINGNLVLYNTGHGRVAFDSTEGGHSGLYSCCDCGEAVDEDDLRYSPNGDYLCADCFYDNYYYCDICGGTESRDDLTEISNGDFLCESCLDKEGYSYCDYCGEYEKETDEHNGSIICQDCIVKKGLVLCDDCEELTDPDDIIEIEDSGESYCPDCIDRNAVQCDGCSEYFSEAEKTEQGGYCEYCLEEATNPEQKTSQAI